MSALHAVFDWLVETSWQVAVLVLLVLLVQAVFGRWLSPRWRYGLWLVVVARLCLPTLPEVEGGLFRSELDPQLFEAPLSTASGPAQVPATQVPGAPPPALPATSEGEDAAATTATAAPVGSPGPRPGALPTTPVVLSFDPAGPEPAPEPAAVLDARAWVVIAWLAAALVLLLRGLGRELAFRRRLALAARVSVPEVHALLDDCRERMGVGRTVELVHTQLVGSPAVTGILRPRILLPDTVLADFDVDELRHVLLHELAHVRRGDVALNTLLTALESVFWFHPLVRLATARLRAAQEPARDWDALAAHTAPAPRQYANTLLRLLERTAVRRHRAPVVGLLRSGRETRKRILMIADFDRTSRKGHLLGASLLVALGWAGFTAAATPPPITEALEGPDAGQELREIVAVRQRPLSDWERKARERLDTLIDVDLEDATLPQALDWFSQQVGLNVVLAPGAREELSHYTYSVNIDMQTAEELLRLICRMTEEDLAWCLTGEAVYLGLRHQVPQTYDLRFYDIQPILDDAYEEDVVDRVVDLVQQLTYPHYNWDDEWVVIQSYGGLLAVNNTDVMHERVHAVLERLLNRGKRTPDDVPAWKRTLQSRLESRIDVEFQDFTLEQVAEQLAPMLGAPVVVGEGPEEVLLDLTLENVRLDTVLGWVANLSERRVAFEDGAVVLGERPTLTTEFYEIESLVTQELELDSLEDLIRNQIDPESWDSFSECIIYPWEDMLIIVQSPAAHREIANLLDALRKIRGE